MFHSLRKDRTAGTRGFAMPLTLAVLLVMSYIVATGLQRIEVSRAEARLAQASITDLVDVTQIEQDILWRGLLETLGKNASAFGLREETYRARRPSNAWNANGRAYVWSPTYPSLSEAVGANALVVITDEASKIDLNHRTEGYLQLLADRAGLGSGQTGRAVRELQDYIEARTPSPLAVDDILRIPQRSGLLDPLEICTLPSWRRWDLCDRPEDLRELTTAGVGLVPNISMMTPENAEFLLGRGVDAELHQLKLQWIELRLSYGFYSPIEGIGQGGERFSVTVIPQSAQRALRFEIDTRVQETGQSFAVRNRRYLPADDLIAGYRQRFPETVTAFLSEP